MAKMVMQSGPSAPDAPGLTEKSKSITLTLSSGAGSLVLPVDTTRIGIYPAASADGRCGLGTVPVAIGAKTGAAASSDLTLGMPLVNTTWHWFDVALRADTTLSFIGAASGVFTIVVV